MTFNDHLTEFAGLPVASYPEARRLEKHGGTTAPDVRSPERDGLADPGSVAWRLDRHGVGDDDPRAHLEGFLEFVGAPAAVRALVVGDLLEEFEVESSDAVRDALAELAPRLPGLRSLFYADLTFEECEASWIEHGNLSSMVTALPGLAEFAVRGTIRLSLEALEHDGLRRLTLQGGGLPAGLTREVVSARLPALEHLELWLGVKDYEGDTTAEDLAPALSGEAFPGLRSLGLRNAEHTGAWVRVLAEAPVTSRLHTLDLSLGTLRDEDVPPLVESPVFRGLRRLDLRRHYLSEEAEKEVRAVFTRAGVEVDLSERGKPDVWGSGAVYYPAVSE
ncbi:STM4015 family protein [Nocardiopsis deserti]|uniref:STM4015 family protein n=1 Tax=Nocardiopsis deserti TaxID=2605988 RepID=UPI00123A5790|nr:STM4015 family protein [Nocardiopsis deserti]